MRNVSPHNSNYFLPGAFLCCPHNTGRVTIFPVVPGVLFSLSSLNKSIQKHNNLMGCQPYAKHRFRQKSERCFCISSGHRDQKGPAHFPASSTEALLDVSPVAAPPNSTAGAACQGQSRRCAAVLRTLDWLSRLCYLPRRDGGYILQSRPLSLDRERAGG